MRKLNLAYIFTVIAMDTEDFIFDDCPIGRYTLPLMMNQFSDATVFTKAEFFETLNADGIAQHLGTRQDGRTFEITVMEA